ncbi:MAG: hypothetical protein LBQ03_03395, partial [Puniceicoccales bacterium]|nr:hypothetical protein [Puniceicoccales bacterium]
SENRRSAAKPVPSSQEEKAFSWLGKKGLKAFLSSEDSEESTPRSVSSRAASSASENSNAEDGLHPGFIRVPASFEVWEKATSMRREDVARLTHQEIVEKAHGRFLIATIVLKDQSRTGSPEWNFADHILQSVDQGIREKLPMTLEELNKFPGKNKFSARELKWIEFLIGKDVEGLRYKNCQAFRNDTDDNLEKNHDYVQTIFPSWSPSAYANTDLYISHKAETWKALLSSCPNIRRNLWLNMQLNAIRMIHFWKFRFAFWQDVPGTSCNRTFVVIEDNPQSPLHREGDHNTLRVTRLIGALTMFGSKGDAPLHEFLEGTLPKHYRKSSSLQFWFSAWEKTPSLIKY